MGRKRKADSSPLAVDSFTEDEGGSPAGKREPKCDSPSQRNNANARERARMRVLSKGFTKLKTALPWVPPDTKLSKLDTLRLASCYIAHLRQLLAEDGAESPGSAANNNKAIDPLKLVSVHLYLNYTSDCM